MDRTPCSTGRKEHLEIAIPIEDPSRRSALFGTTDRNLRLIRAAFGVRISARDNVVHISGPSEDVRKSANVIESLQRALRATPELGEEEIHLSIEEAKRDGHGGGGQRIDVFLPSTSFAPRGAAQQHYVDAMYQSDLTFCVGPAGTGKTFLAVAFAVSMLKGRKIKRIALVRPAVEAGERLGYLPGDLQAKVNPYLRPLFDAMNEMMTYDQIRRFMQEDVIEVIPLAFMRGRTLSHAVIILDEAQNSSPAQMLMFLTRMGQHSKMIVTGDASQSDLPGDDLSGLSDAIGRLEGTANVAVARLENCDIVRHELVQRVVEAYAKKQG